MALDGHVCNAPLGEITEDEWKAESEFKFGILNGEFLYHLEMKNFGCRVWSFKSGMNFSERTEQKVHIARV